MKKDGSNSLHIAALNGQFGLVKYFTKDCQMDPQTVNELGKSAIMLAQHNRHHHIEEYLMSLSDEKHGAPSGLEKKLTLIHQEEIEHVKLKKDKEIEQLKKIPQAKHRPKHTQHLSLIHI